MRFEQVAVTGLAVLAWVGCDQRRRERPRPATTPTIVEQPRTIQEQRGSGTVTQPTEQPRELVAALHQKNRTEIETATLAQKKAKSQAIRQFAQRLERDHRAADEKVLAFARRRGIDLTAETPPPPQASPVVQLRKLEGEQFDRQFLTTMVEGHAQTIQMLGAAKRDTQDAELRSLIDQLLPTVEQHHQIALELMGAQKKREVQGRRPSSASI